MAQIDDLLFGSFRFKRAAEQLWSGERLIELRTKPLRVLRYLLENPGRLITKEEFQKAIWTGTYVSNRVLTVCVSEIRTALGDDAEKPRFIENVHGRGYRFIADVNHVKPETRFPAARPPSFQQHALSFVGRETELAHLHNLLDKMLAGERQVVFVSGEAGIGKTALVEQFVEKVREEKIVRIGRGQCIEQYGAGEAYLPLLEALGRLCREPEGEQVIKVLQRYAPSWLRQLPGILEEATPSQGQGMTREQMLRELAEAVEIMAEEQGVILWLEDLQWSDHSTLEWISSVAQRQERARLLILGAFRPIDVALSGHQLKAVKQDLLMRGHCTELQLELLTLEETTKYVTKRFSESFFTTDLARLIHQRTDGNALFMINVADYLVKQGSVRQNDGNWVLKNDLTSIGVPETLRQMIERQVERLSEEAQQILETASVVGVEFPVAAVAAGLKKKLEEIEERCETLARKGQFLQERGVDEWPDGTVTGRYGFLHALYQEVLYNRIAGARRVRLHKLIAEREQTGHQGREFEVAGELAARFEQGREYERAVHYRRLAGEAALRRHAYWEAITHLTKGLELSKGLPDTPERMQNELLLQMTLGVSLAATKGFGSPEMAAVYERARLLCQHFEDPTLLSQVLVGQWTAHLVRGELQVALSLATQNLELAQNGQNPLFLLQSYTVLAATHYFLGEFARAREYLELAAVPYEFSTLLSDGSLFPGQVNDVTTRTFLGLVLGELGYPDQGRTRLAEGMGLAQECNIPFALALALAFGGLFYQFSRESRAAEKHAKQTIALGTEQGFELWTTLGTLIQGWALVEQGQGELGIVQLQQGLSALRTTGAQLVLASYLATLAESYGRIGQIEEGCRMIDKALEFAEDSEVQWHKPELYRVHGELILQQRTRRAEALRRRVEEAEGCFRQAMGIAHDQGAKLLELRAAISLCRLLWKHRNKKEDAQRILAEIYGWFTEGFDTADLQEAQALLEELQSGSQQLKQPSVRRLKQSGVRNAQ